MIVIPVKRKMQRMEIYLKGEHKRYLKNQVKRGRFESIGHGIRQCIEKEMERNP